MKEAAPRIFRSLELPKGSDDFDMIVAAAVSAYGSLRLPTERQSRDFGRLVAPLWEHIAMETRRAVAASLSHAPIVPRVIVDLLVAAPVEVAAPFLVSSPVLSSEDLKRLSASGDARLVRLVEGRQARALPVAPPAAVAPEPVRTPLPRVEAPGIAADFIGEAPQPPTPQQASDAVSLTRETLKRLALTGRRRPEATVDPASLDALLAHARTRDGGLFYKTLANLLRVNDERLRAIETEASGAELAAALKALQAREADALTVLMLMKPEVGEDVSAFEAMTRIYRALDADGCRRSFWGFSAPMRKGEAEMRRARAEREPPRAVFGRRAISPPEASQREKKGS